MAPILLGSVIGIALSFGTIHVINLLAADAAGRHEAVFQYHPLVFTAAVLASVLTVFISAWLPARKLSKLTPLEAIRNTGKLQLKKKKHSPILSLLFGIEGELAGNALKAQRKALRTSTLSLTFSFLGFAVMLCFFTLSDISTNHTYFERYQDAWDIMVTVKDTEIEHMDQLEEILEGISKLQGVRSCAAYQKAAAVGSISETDISNEVNTLGGLKAVAGSSVTMGEDSYLVQFLPLSMWKEIAGEIGNTEQDTYIRVLAKEGITLTQLNALEADIVQVVSREYTVESENRIQEKVSDENMKKGSMLIFGAFCALLAVIGIANVFSNTLGFLRQRKREFAQYMSVGMTLEGMRKMFCIEALVIAGRPLYAVFIWHSLSS